MHPVHARTLPNSSLHWHAIAFAAIAFASTNGAAKAQTFRGLGLPPGQSSSASRAISADGTVVVGDGGTAFAGAGFRWTAAGGMQSLGTWPGGTFSFVPSVSGDGTVVVGYGDTGGQQRSFRWTSATGFVNLGGSASQPQVLASDTDDHGAVIIGTMSSATGYRAFRWTNAGGLVSLGTLPTGLISFGYACNADGSVIVGDSDSFGGDVAFRWTAAGGMQSLGTLPGGTFSFAYAVSADGAVVVGDSDSSTGDLAYRWTAATGMQSLGTLPVPFTYMLCNAVNADGSAIAGATVGPTDVAFLWTTALGLVDLNVYLPTLGIDLTGWTLTDAGAISADGLTIAGTGTHNGVDEAWLCTLPRAYVTYGQGCAGSAGVPTLAAQGAPTLGQPFTVRVLNLPSTGGLAVMVFGLSDALWNGQALPRSLTSLGLPGCSALCSADATTLLLHTNGTATATLTIPAAPGLAGLSFFQQAVSLDAAAGNAFGGAVSNGGRGQLH